MRGESARPGKRPLRALSAVEKMEAIQRVHEGESKASVARDIGVPESTLRGWCKSEHKIRGMARNSSTPDSEVHSPASSSGNNLTMISGAANHSSEDESAAAKRAKIDQQQSAVGIVGGGTVGGSTSTGNNNIGGGLPGSSFCANENSENEASRLTDASKIDYVGLMTSMAGIRPENSSLLLQQLGLHFGANNPLAKSLLNLPTNSSAQSGAAAVGLVDYGLQYTKSNKRHTLSAIAPAQMDSVAKSCSRKSLPPAAEAPLTPVPASPRKTNDIITNNFTNNLSNNFSNNLTSNNHNLTNNYLNNNKIKNNHNKDSISNNITNNNSLNNSNSSNSNSSSNNNNNISNHNNKNNNQNSNNNTNNNSNSNNINNNNDTSGKTGDEQLWMWLARQQQLIGQQSVPFNPCNQQDGSWFWQWYKHCSFPLLNPSPLTIPTNNNNNNINMNNSQISKKSPSKARALLDNVLCNNNNENLKQFYNNDINTTGDVDVQGAGDISTEEAIEHGEKFFKWLDKCSDPAVTRLQIMQFKYLLDNLKSCKRKSSSFKQSRK